MNPENHAHEYRVHQASWLVKEYALSQDDMALVLGRDIKSEHSDIVEDDEDRFVIDTDDGTVFGFFRSPEEFVAFTAYGGWRVSKALESIRQEVQR